MNNKKIDNLAHPTEDSDATNKKYVDDQIKAIPAVVTSDLLKLDGSRAMTGNLNMDGQKIINISTFVEDDSSQSASDAQKYDVVPWGKIHEIRGDLKREINQVASESLSRTDNGDKMDVNLNMNNNKIYNLADPITGTDALNLNFGNRKYLKVDGTNQMKGNLDMDNKQINNLADGAHDGDAVNVTQLINMTTTVNTEISKVKTEISVKSIQKSKSIPIYKKAQAILKNK